MPPFSSPTSLVNSDGVPARTDCCTCSLMKASRASPVRPRASATASPPARESMEKKASVAPAMRLAGVASTPLGPAKACAAVSAVAPTVSPTFGGRSPFQKAFHVASATSPLAAHHAPNSLQASWGRPWPV